MGKRDLLKAANRTNSQNRGTEAVLNEAPTTNEPPQIQVIKEVKEIVPTPAVQEKKEVLKEESTSKKLTEIPTPPQATEPKTEKASKTISNLDKYTGEKAPISIMLSRDDNIYVSRKAAYEKKPLQVVFGEILADTIVDVKNGKINQELAEKYLLPIANNQRRNVFLPKDLIDDIKDTASMIPLKQGKFIQYALELSRTSNN